MFFRPLKLVFKSKFTRLKTTNILCLLRPIALYLYVNLRPKATIKADEQNLVRKILLNMFDQKKEMFNLHVGTIDRFRAWARVRRNEH